MLTAQDDILDYRAKVLLSGLKLELLGLSRRGPSCYKMVKAEYGLKGSKQKVYDQFKEMLDGQVQG